MGGVVARECHEDGQYHLHVVLLFDGTKNFKDPKWADFLTSQHGNYQSVRNLKRCLQYVSKADESVLEWGMTIKEIIMHQGTTAARVAKMCEEKKTLMEINNEFPGFMLMNRKKVEDYLMWMIVTMKSPVWDHVFTLSSSEAVQTITGWLNWNICHERQFKQKQLWIHGPPNMGKTSLIMELAEQIRVLPVTKTEKFIDHYQDGMFDLLVFDEFKGQRPITWMNEFLQGSPMVIARKGSQVMKMGNPPVIILSNFNVHEAYRHASRQALLPLITRLIVVEIDEFINIHSQ